MSKLLRSKVAVGILKDDGTAWIEISNPGRFGCSGALAIQFMEKKQLQALIAKLKKLESKME